MKKILIAATVSFGLVSSFASAQELPTYAKVSECLKKVCATVNGQTGCLAEGTHFRASQASQNNDAFAVSTRVNVVAFPDALWDHPIWKTKKADIDACITGLMLTKKN